MTTRTSVGRDFQDNVLGRVCERGQVATLFLRNRMSLRGRILEFDPYVILLEPLDGGPPQLVYKSAVVSISAPRPARPPGRPPMGRPRPMGPEGGPRSGPPREGGPYPYPPREGAGEGPPPPRFREPRPPFRPGGGGRPPEG